jgi:putative ABC transport system permease protein
VRLVRGRPFTDHDAAGAPRVAIINEHLARLAFGDEDPIGRLLEIVPNPRGARWMARPGPLTIVGVAGGVKQVGINEVAIAEVIVPFAQWPAPTFEVIARTAGRATPIAAGLRTAVARVDPDIPVGAAVTLEQRVDEALRRDRFNLLLISTFAAVALLIAGVGIYGTVAYVVEQREREFGVRLALGATPGRIVRSAVSLSLRFGLLGGVIGLAAALVVARLIGSALYLVPGQHEGLLYGVRTSDPLALSGAVLIVVAVAGAAGFFPARRVGRIDPMLALRQD